MWGGQKGEGWARSRGVKRGVGGGGQEVGVG